MKSLKLKSLLIKEEDEGLDKKVKSAIKKIEKCCEDDNDVTGALKELAKLIGDKKCVSKLDAIEEIEKAEEGTPYFIDQYRKEIQNNLLTMAKEKFSSKELGAIISAMN